VKSTGRRALIVAMCPPDRPVIDVGADHGHVAHALGAIATERDARRIGRRDVRWVVADGLLPFRCVPVAVIAGMGALTIARILAAGPRPDVVVCHAPDDPGTLRRWLAANGWRIDAEGLAKEGPRYAEVIRVVPGVETATDLPLEFGPRLLESGHPLLGAHLRRTAGLWRTIARATATADPVKHAEASRRVAFLEAALAV